MDENWIMVIAEMRHVPGLSHKAENTIIFGLDNEDQEAIEQKYDGCVPPCLVDSQDGRSVATNDSDVNLLDP